MISPAVFGAYRVAMAVEKSTASLSVICETRLLPLFLGPFQEIRNSQLVCTHGGEACVVRRLARIDKLAGKLDQVCVRFFLDKAFWQKLLCVHQVKPGDCVGLFLVPSETTWNRPSSAIRPYQVMFPRALCF